ncbi:MAG TPA: hypothetical protein VMT34_13260 [Aggregatilineales bacterium]|nr:hypothetical protein [Aggregatilineales bacterium]
MNRFMQEQWPMFEGTLGMRAQMMDILTDADLEFNPGGKNMTLGALCREMGEIDYSYIQSLKTFTQNWNYHNPEPGLDGTVARLKAWYTSLEAEMKAAISAMSDDDLKKPVERGFALPVEIQMQVYLQALLIFFGKATIYLKAMNKPLPKSIQEWIW